MANKQDLEGAESAEKIYELLDLDQFIKSGQKKDIFYQGCSAKTGEGIWEGIKVLSEAITNLENSNTGRTSVLDQNKKQQIKQ